MTTRILAPADPALADAVATHNGWREHLRPRGTGCTTWRGPTDVDGHPFATVGAWMLPARRVALIAATGLDAPDARPACGNPACVNPRHVTVA